MMLALQLAAAAWLLTSWNAGPAAESAEPAAFIVDERRLDYAEDEGTGRRLAAIHAVLERRGATIALRVTAAAIGPQVDAIPGWQGIRGANRITAEELGAIVEKGRMRVETDGAGLREPLLGAASPGRRGRVPERRRSAGGSIDVGATTEVDYTLELIAATPPLGNGLRRTRLVVDGVPRLEVTTFTRGDRGRILDVRALHEPDPPRTP
jgi:hypothetical protein